MTGLLQTAQTLPFLLLSIPAGVFADRVSRRRLMVGGETLRVASLLAVLVLAGLGLLTVPSLALLGFIGASATVVYSVTAPALVPTLVSAQALARANGRIELARTLAFAGGPALAGALIGSAGAASAFAFAAVLSSGAVFLLAGLPEPPGPPLPRRHPLHDVREGSEFIFGHALLRPIFLTQFIYNTAFFIIQAVFVPYALHHLGLSASSVGAILATFGAGMVLGALIAPAITRAVTFGGLIAIGPIAGSAAGLLLALTYWAPSGLIAALGFFLLGSGGIIWVVGTTTLRQTVTPPRLLGRASAINAMAYGARPLGAAIGAGVGGYDGAEACLFLAAAAFVLQIVVILASPVVKLATQP